MVERRLLRCVTVWAAATWAAITATAVLLPLARACLPGAPRVEGFEGGLVGGCAAAGLGCLAWLWVLTTVVVLEAATARGWQAPGVPPQLRRVLLAACGVVLVAGSTAPAVAASHGATGGEQGRERMTRSSLQGLPMPDRPVGGSTAGWVAAAARQARAEKPGATAIERVVVRPGDSLWAIAARHLHDDPGQPDEGLDPVAVTSLWQRIHELNGTVVGADPDLIHPGDRLWLPPV